VHDRARRRRDEGHDRAAPMQAASPSSGSCSTSSITLPAWRAAAIKTEIDRLLDHVGIDKQTVATNERAKKVLGPELTRRIDRLANKRFKIKESQRGHRPRWAS
jgi:hypothetical protein